METESKESPADNNMGEGVYHPANNIGVSVFDYTDYSQFLREAIDSAVHKERLSQQALANYLGLSQKVQVYRILHGQRKQLPQNLVKKLSFILGLNARESEYFSALVQFNEAQSLEQKNKAYDALHKIIRPVKQRSVEKKEFDFLKTWYGPVIREILTMTGKALSAKEIAKKLKPSVSLAEVEQSIQMIIELDLVKQNAEGKYELNHPKLRISKDESELAARNFNQKHFEILAGAQGRSGNYPNRFVCATFGASEQGATIISSKIHEMTQELSDLMTHMDQDKDQVYQFNVQLFPLTEKIEIKEREGK